LTRRTEFPTVIVATFLITAALFASPVSSYLGWAWRVEFTLDRNEYPAGSEGLIDLSVLNSGPTILDIYEAAVMFDWQKESGQYWYVKVDVEVKPSQIVRLAKFKFTIPENGTAGTHTFQIGLKHRHLGLREGWQDDGLQWFESTYEILVTKVEKPNLELVEITQTPEREEGLYVGDIGTLALTLKNTGGATAKQVKVAVEDTKANIISVIESTPPRDLASGSAGQWTIKVRGEKIGESTFKLRFYISGTVIEEQEFPVKISEPPLELVSQTRTPEEGRTIYPGDLMSATFTLRNKGPSTVNEIAISVETPSGLTLVESSPSISIEPDATGQLNFKIKPERPGQYSVKILFTKSGIQMPSYKATANIAVSEKPVLGPEATGLGIMALVILVAVALVVSRRRRIVKAAMPAADAFCPNCGARTAPEGGFCQSCGTRLRATGNP